MPIYEYQCACGRVSEEYAREARKAVGCACGQEAKRILSVPAPHAFKEGFDEFAGEYFTSPEDKRKKLRAKGLEEAGGGGIKDRRGRLYNVSPKGNSVPWNG